MYTCHSGGCPGADMTWETEGDKYGIHTIAYSFHNHIQSGKNQKILTQDELAEGYRHVEIASIGLKRSLNYPGMYPYVKNLLARNWYQVKGADAIFAVGQFERKTPPFKRVKGGTGWAVQMAVDNQKPVYFFDQTSTAWWEYNYVDGLFELMVISPELTKNFAGIGTREITDDGVRAIQQILQQTFP
jgi:hypothetical protein